MRQPFRAAKSAAGSGQFLVTANPDGFEQTLARCYTEEAADILVEALRMRQQTQSSDPLPRPPICVDTKEDMGELLPQAQKKQSSGQRTFDPLRRAKKGTFKIKAGR